MIRFIPGTATLALLFLALLTIPASLDASVNAQLASFSIRIHYQRQARDFGNAGLWAWDDIRQPMKNWPSDALLPSGETDFGIFWDLKLASEAKKISFLIVDRNTGEKEAGSKVFAMNEAHNELWIREKDDKVYVGSDFAERCEALSAQIIDERLIEVRFSGQVNLEPERILPLFQLHDRTGNELLVEQIRVNGSQIELVVGFDLKKVPLQLKFDFQELECDLAWKLVDRLYAYDGNDLGCAMNSSQSASLKLWAPKAEAVSLLIFDRNDQTRQLVEKAMSYEDKGVWYAEVNATDLPDVDELSGYYYQYEVKNPGKDPVRVLDPYARSMAAVTVSPDGTDAGSSLDSIGKAAFVNAAGIGNTPAPFQISNFHKREDAIIYEVHVRDFTSDPEIVEDLEARWGTFAAFKSRLSYIRSLGVTHIQLLPVMAWYFGDETRMNAPELEFSAKNNQYNWGYDPQNYFSIDGAYSENPSDAALRIAEFKDLVDAIHQAGMGVIIDVVYTHMAKADFLENIVPGYYFFQAPDGTLLGDFGNNLATNRKMSEKLVVDSVRHWFEVYRIDGMRWDMMGDATRSAVQKAFDVAREINGQAIFIGEGWRTFKGHLEDPALTGHGADQDWMSETDSVGVFSDEFRNELKSGFGCEGEPMFLTGGPRNIGLLFSNIKAQPENTPVTAPGDMVQYIAAHDNLPLFDVIAQSIKKDPDDPANFLEIHRRIRLGNAILLTSQGTAFIHAGQEFGRSKQWRTHGVPEHKFHEMVDANGQPFKFPYFIHDSYDASDAINKFNWKKATDATAYPVNVTTREYTSGLIRLRRSSDAFHLGSLEEVNANVKLIAAPEIDEKDLVIAYSCEALDKTVFYVFINADNRLRKLTLKIDLTQAEVLVDGKNAGITALARPEGFRVFPDTIEIEPLTALVFKARK